MLNQEIKKIIENLQGSLLIFFFFGFIKRSIACKTNVLNVDILRKLKNNRQSFN